MPERAVFSHETAAAMWGMPLPSGRDASPGLLHVSVPIGTAAPSGRGVAGHRLHFDSDDIVIIHGVRVTSQARTWCDLAATLNDENLVAAGDFLLWRRRSSAVRLSIADLEHAVAQFRGRGLLTLVRCLPELSDRSDSPPESIIRLRVVRFGLPRPEVNGSIYDEHGYFLAMPDLLFRRYRLAFDYEGGHHNQDPTQWEKDIARVPRLQSASWSHIRGARADLADSTSLLTLFSERLVAAGWDGSPE
jgi:hypothetical protein